MLQFLLKVVHINVISFMYRHKWVIDRPCDLFTTWPFPILHPNPSFCLILPFDLHLTVALTSLWHLTIRTLDLARFRIGLFYKNIWYSIRILHFIDFQIKSFFIYNYCTIIDSHVGFFRLQCVCIVVVVLKKYQELNVDSSRLQRCKI